MYTTVLREFVEVVPVCAAIASLDVVVTLLRQAKSGRLLMVDQHATPVGIIESRHLFPHLPALLSTAQPTAEWMALLPTLLEPVDILPIDCELSQVYAHLQVRRSPYWVLVDAEGAVVGLFDLLQFWRYVATHPGAINGTSQSPVSIEPLTPNELGGLQFRVLRQLIRVIEQLPLPLMLQTGTGQVVSQNLAWRQHIGELNDLANVQREAALFLETLPTRLPNAHSLENLLDASQFLTDGLPLSDSAPLRPPIAPLTSDRYSHAGGAHILPGFSSHSETATACSLGTDSNTCVCVCSMKNGQERVWQFIKIHLGVVADDSETSWGHNPSSHFQLASLEATTQSSRSLGLAGAIAPSETLWLVQAQDTTEQQQVARELAAKNADLIQLNRLKDEFLACISHELKTPLTSVLGLSSLLKDQLLGPLNERQARYAQLIYQGGRHLILIVNDILDLTRIETGQLELIVEPITIQTVCQRAFEQARQLLLMADPNAAATKDFKAIPETQFSLEIEPTLSTLIADELRLRQMLANLLSNALKFTEAGGKIGLKVSLWEGWIAFTVWDTGIGIPANKQHLIFQKFQQLENPLTRRFEGTGLGLVLTQRLARLHGGDVTFTSIEGEGSEFTLLLPPSPPLSQGVGVAREVVKSAPPVVLSKRLVMVVEAAPRFLEDLTQQLTELGYRVAIARSGNEALEKIRRLQPAVVFLNPVLPLLSGWDVLTLLKSDNETRHIPVVVTATRAEKRQAYSNGANSFLSLPIQTDALRHNLEYWASRPSSSGSEEVQTGLTVLHLHPVLEPGSKAFDPSPIADLNSLLHPYHCRVLEVDDLEQADLLVRVWKPNLILLDGMMPNPVHYLTQLSQSPFLAALPLVTLTPEMTQAANQIPGLVVFPCFASLTPDPTTQTVDASALWQVMQIAVGTHWTSHVLIADVATLPFDLNADKSGILGMGAIAHPGSTQKVNEWLQVLLQYVQTGGFRGSLGRSWADVLHQTKHGGVDLLLLCVHPADVQGLQPAMQTLAQMEPKPPVLVWNCYSSFPIEPELAEAIEAIADRILPPSLSMQELLGEIQHILADPEYSKPEQS